MIVTAIVVTMLVGPALGGPADGNHEVWAIDRHRPNGGGTVYITAGLTRVRSS